MGTVGGPRVDGEGEVFVRVPLTAERGRALLEVLRAEINWSRCGPGENYALDRLAVEVRSAAGRRPLDIPAWDFDVFSARLSTASLNAILTADGVSCAMELSREFGEAGRTTVPPDRRRPPRDVRPIHDRVIVPEPGEAEAVACGWHSLAHLRERYPDGEVALPSGSDDQLRAAYLNGSCGTFAAAVREVAGGEFVVVIERWNRVPKHVAVLLPDGRYADARGDDLTRDELVAGYGRWREAPPLVVEVPGRRVATTFLRHPAQYDAAREHVALLLPDLAPSAGPRR